MATTETIPFITILNDLHRMDTRQLSKFLQSCFRKCDEAKIPEPEEEVQGNASERLLARLEEDGGEEYSVLYWELYGEATTLLASLRSAPRRDEPPRGHAEPRQPPRKSDAISSTPRRDVIAHPPARTQEDVRKKFGFVMRVVRDCEFAWADIVVIMEHRLQRRGIQLPAGSTLTMRIMELEEAFEDAPEKSSKWTEVYEIVDSALAKVLDAARLSDEHTREEEREAYAKREQKRQEEAAERKRQEEEAHRVEAAAARKAQQQARSGDVAAARDKVLATAAEAAAAPEKPRDNQRGSSGNSVKGMKMCPSCAAACLETMRFCGLCGHNFMAPPPPPAAEALDAVTAEDIATMMEAIEAEHKAAEADATETVAAEETTTEAAAEETTTEATTAAPSGKPVQGKGEAMKAYRKRLAAWAEKL